MISCNSSSDASNDQQQTGVQFDAATRDSLKTVILEWSDDDEVSGDYFTYFGFRDWYRWPLVYPYSLNAVDAREDGFLCDESNAKDVTTTNKGVKQLDLHSIQRFSFNKDIFVAETFANGKKRYRLFQFSDQQIVGFPSKDALMTEASKHGKLIFEEMITLEEYSEIF